MKNILPVILLVTVSLITIAQSPQSIPYQAVVRNTDGSVIGNTALTMTFKIHDATAIGTVVYEEMHATTSNAQGLVAMNVGEGTPVTGNFSNINWGNGAKFLQVLMDAGNGAIDLGTQKMMSVPYSLYAEDIKVRVSNSGDSLFIGDQYSIVPGVSLANPTSISNYGSVLLPGTTTCQSEFISVTGCGGQDSVLYFDKYYSLVEIGGQCWFAENLATDKYSNGDVIDTDLSNATWQSTFSGAFALYADNPANDGVYGKLYNWFATIDERGLCPSGWHVPSDCEWMYLEDFLDMPSQELQTLGSRGAIAGKVKSSLFWAYSGVEITNSSNFSLVPGGCKYNSANYGTLNDYGYYWSSSQDIEGYSFLRRVVNYDNSILRDSNLKISGYSIRCIKD